MSNNPTFEELLAKRPQLAYHPSNGLLFDGVSLTEIAQKMGTPCWVMSADTLRRRLHRVQKATRASSSPISIHFAIKSNDSLAVIDLMAQESVGGDIVSYGELLRAQKAGMPASSLIYSGVGKTTWEIKQALNAGIGQINAESAEEVSQLADITAQLQTKLNIVLRINPDVDAGTHKGITTGKADTKFGIPISQAIEIYRFAQKQPFLNAKGFAVHIGSQITTVKPFQKTFAKVRELVEQCRKEGLPVTSVDCGGGLGVSYKDETELDPQSFVRTIDDALGDLNLALAIEPGRWLTAPSGVLLSEVILTKKHEIATPFLIIDASMSDFIRPGMYDAWHGFLPLSTKRAQQPQVSCNIAGPVCENTDTFTRARPFPLLEHGDLVAILDTGAYGTVMSSTYNTRPLAEQVMIEDGDYRLIRKRQTYEQIFENEIIS